MNALQSWLALRGRGFSLRLHTLTRVLQLAIVVTTSALTPSTYNKATRLVIEKQIYFTAWQILPGFAAFSALFSFLIIDIVASAGREYGLYEYSLELIVRVLILEILPLMTALFVALRTGAAINTEVALMRIQKELDALERIGVDPMRLELLPRVIGGTVSVAALTAVNVVVALWISHLVVIELNPWTLTAGDFTQMIGKVLDVATIAVLWLKTLAFGLAVTVIPIASGMGIPQKLFYAPIAVLRGMVRLFFALMLIETMAITVLYI